MGGMGKDNAKHHGTHPHAYEQLLVGWMTGAVCYGGGCEGRGAEDHHGTTQHPPHAYKQLLVGWIVGATGGRGNVGPGDITDVPWAISFIIIFYCAFARV